MCCGGSLLSFIVCRLCLCRLCRSRLSSLGVIVGLLCSRMMLLGCIWVRVCVVRLVVGVFV